MCDKVLLFFIESGPVVPFEFTGYFLEEGYFGSRDFLD